MFRFLFGLFIILHGLVHLWYFTLSQRLVEFKPEMGWTGESWIFSTLLAPSTTRLLASALFVLATVAFVIRGFGIFFRTEWWRPMLLGSALFSSVILCLLWDGTMQFLVQKGLVGFLISLTILIALLLLKQPAFVL
jgi:hypothetical protein